MNSNVKVPLNLPPYMFKTRIDAGNEQIFDVVRKKYIILTPEEWVRQHYINYLVNYRGVPVGLIGVEVAFMLNGVNHRADIVVYNKQGKPVAIVECKAPDIELNSNVVNQIARYNILLQAKYLFITNGIKNYSVQIDWQTESFSPLNAIPDYTEMIK